MQALTVRLYGMKTLQKIDGAKLIDLYPEKKTLRIPFGKIAVAASVSS